MTEIREDISETGESFAQSLALTELSTEKVVKMQ